MFVTALPIITDVSPLQFLKTCSPMLITELPIVADVSPLQSQNACLLMLVTEFGIVIEERLLQLRNAPLQINLQSLLMLQDVMSVETFVTNTKY